MFRFHRLLIVYAIAVPLALMLGYLLATPDLAAFAVVGLVLFILVLPILIQKHHWMLILSWNSAFILGFLPGQLQLWALCAVITFTMGVIHRFMGHRNFLRAPELTKPLLFLTTVILLTGKIRGGLGFRTFGSSSFGGRNYFYVLIAIIGYFALISQPVPPLKRASAAKWFFLAGTTTALSNMLYALGPAAYFLYWIIPSGAVGFQVAATWNESEVQRIAGLGPAGPFLLCFLLARWGIRGLFEWDKPWRFLLVMVAVVASMFSGFRAQVISLVLLFAIQFMIEGLWKTPLLPVVAVLGMLCMVPVIIFANKLPGAVQRSLAFLPVDINPDIRADAEGSINWRLDMWREVWLEVPKYLMIGKGYAIDPNDLYVTSVSGESAYAGSMLAGDYHNGPLSILVPFGVFGTLAFFWLLGAGVKVLYCNFRYGDARMRRVNTTLLAYFLTQIVLFIFVFGAFNGQLAAFLGVLAFGISLNGGVCRRPAVSRQSVLAPSLAAPLAAAG